METRRQRIAEVAELSTEELDALSSGKSSSGSGLASKGLVDAQAEHMVENAIGVMSLPLGLCVNMRVDDRDHLVPMAVEETSVVAAAKLTGPV